MKIPEKTYNEPIMVFKNQSQLTASLKEWQKRLGLNDWEIKAIIDDMDECPYRGVDCTHLAVEKSAIIRIHKDDCNIELRDIKVRKSPQELTLVHELLHCKMSILEHPNSAEGQSVYYIEHTAIEDIAKALIMAKYNITLDWFKI
jgi:hypothetical protein